MLRFIHFSFLLFKNSKKKKEETSIENRMKHIVRKEKKNNFREKMETKKRNASIELKQHKYNSLMRTYFYCDVYVVVVCICHFPFFEIEKMKENENKIPCILVFTIRRMCKHCNTFHLEKKYRIFFFDFHFKN